MSAGAPAVSVVVPVFDCARYLADALASIRQQDFRHYEVLVVDDGSTDGSGDVAASFDEVLVVRHDTNRGASAARNTGIERARGPLIAFLDADDRWRPRKLRLQVEQLSQSPALGCSVALTQDFLEPGTERPAWLRPSALERPTLNLMPSALLVRREVFDDIGTFDPRLLIHEDTDWFRRCDRAGVARGIVDEVLVDRRVHTRNLSHRNPGGIADYPRFLKQHLDRSRSLDER